MERKNDLIFICPKCGDISGKCKCTKDQRLDAIFGEDTLKIKTFLVDGIKKLLTVDSIQRITDYKCRICSNIVKPESVIDNDLFYLIGLCTNCFKNELKTKSIIKIVEEIKNREYNKNLAKEYPFLELTIKYNDKEYKLDNITDLFDIKINIKGRAKLMESWRFTCELDELVNEEFSLGELMESFDYED